MSEINILSRLSGEKIKTGVICCSDGSVIYGQGIGKVGHVVGEVCFNTSLTGYQEILSDPSYAQQIVIFTFPHIGNVGTNPEDLEANKIWASGFIIREGITHPSNWRATNHLMRWAIDNELIGIAEVDTRSLTSLIRDNGALHAVIAHHPEGKFDIKALIQQAKEWKGLVGLDLAKTVTSEKNYEFSEGLWGKEKSTLSSDDSEYHVVVIDYGIKKNILRCVANFNCRITVVPATSSFQEIMSYNPDGILLSNGPGDPAATGIYAVPVIQSIIKANIPLFGICLGHQLLALALGGKTEKMKFGHHGANHPVRNTKTQTVEITSMNHGFTVARDSLPSDVTETHISLFDGTNCGIALKNKPVFSVQYHPEASPGPQDSFYLFEKFYQDITTFNKQKSA